MVKLCKPSLGKENKDRRYKNRQPDLPTVLKSRVMEKRKKGKKDESTSEKRGDGLLTRAGKGGFCHQGAGFSGMQHHAGGNPADTHPPDATYGRDEKKLACRLNALVNSAFMKMGAIIR